MRYARALPITPLMPAAGSHKLPVATPLMGGLPGKTERPHPFSDPHVGHPLNHSVFARPSPADYAADPRRPQGRSSSLRSGRSTLSPTADPPP
jgi:hypothetical protein